MTFCDIIYDVKCIALITWFSFYFMIIYDAQNGLHSAENFISEITFAVNELIETPYIFPYIFFFLLIVKVTKIILINILKLYQ